MKKSIKLVSIVLALVLILALAVGFVACNKKSGGNQQEVVESFSVSDLKGKTVACIGEGAVPGLTFQYILAKNNIEVITEGTPNENQVKIIWAADGTIANTAVVNGSADYAVVGEPAATALSARFGYNLRLDLQAEYAKCEEANGATYPQAGIFVKSDLALNSGFMSALFAALDANKQWIAANKADVTAYMQENLYESATFPAASLDRCAINASEINSAEQQRIVAFLKNIAPNTDWDSKVSTIFASSNREERAEFSGSTTLRFAAPEGTPALAIGHMATANTTLYGATMQYAAVAPSLIKQEMAANTADIVIMPINAGATLIANGKDYKLVSVAVDGSLYLIGNKQ